MTVGIVLIAHGSPVASANEDLFRMVEMLRQSGRYGIVEPAFLESAQPSIPEGLDACVAQGADCVVVIPYFLLMGRHVRRDLPEFLQQAQERHPQVKFVLGEQLGGHEALAEIVLERVRSSNFLV